MRLYFLWFLFPLFSFAEGPSPKLPYRAFLNNLENGEYLTVYSKMGVHWKTCDRIKDSRGVSVCKEAVGWLDRNAFVNVVGNPVEVEVRNPFTGEKEKQKYVEVEFTYPRLGPNGEMIIQDNRGFIEYHNVFTKPMNAFYSTDDRRVLNPSQGSLKKDDCPPTVPDSKQKETRDIAQPIQEAVRNIGVNEAADRLKYLVGQCVTSPATRFPSPLPPGNAYDYLVLNKIKKVKPPPVLREDGKPMTQEDLINIDALARTLYGEMGRCYRYGLHYPMAVAKVIINRNESTENVVQFVQDPAPQGKPRLSRVATKPSQFTMWLANSDNRPLHQGLCPGRKSGEPFYYSDNASKEEEDIWRNTVKIASEAVLFPSQFKNRTRNIKYTLYTSGKAKDRNTARLNPGARFINSSNQRRPTIEGRTVNRDECLEIWEEDPALVKARKSHSGGANRKK